MGDDRGIALLFSRLVLISRWLLAPFFMGLIAAIIVLFIRFIRQLFVVVASIWAPEDHDAVLAVLALVDTTLIASLLLVLLFSGYQNFVARIPQDRSDHLPYWLESTSFLDLKIKFTGAVVVISAVDLLRVFLHSEQYMSTVLAWKVGIHLAFVLATVLLAFTNWLLVAARASSPRSR